MEKKTPPPVQQVRSIHVYSSSLCSLYYDNMIKSIWGIIVLTILVIMRLFIIKDDDFNI